jgi:aspartate kinase
LEREPDQARPSSDSQARAELAAYSPDAVNVVERLREANMEDLLLNDVSLDDTQSLVTIMGVPNRPGVAAQVFQSVADGGVFVDMIVQSHKGYQGQISVSFTTPAKQLERALQVARGLASQLDCTAVTHRARVAKLSVGGIGLRSHTGVAIRMFRALAEAQINVDMISTSEVRVNVVIDGEQGRRGLQQLQAAFADVLR